MALFTCDQEDCYLFRKERPFDNGFSCPRESSITGAPCGGHEVTTAGVAPPPPPPSGQNTSSVGSWGLDRARVDAADEDDRETQVIEPVTEPPRRQKSNPWVIILPLLLVLILAIGGGAYVFRDKLSGAVGGGASSGAMVEERLFSALLSAGYSREISDKILSVRRQVQAIRDRGEASTPELMKQLAEIEAKLALNANERRAAFQSYVKTVEQLGKEPADEVDEALAKLNSRLAADKLSRLQALVPVMKQQIIDARSGKKDHDRWISQIEVAPI